MPTHHTVRQGDCLSSIVARHGFAPDVVWRDPANAELKRLRGDPNILYPGDVVVIPDRQPRNESAATDARHRFVRKGTPAFLRVRLLRRGEARANLGYRLSIDGRDVEGNTDGDGVLEQEIPPDAREAVLMVEGEDPLTLALGHLDPVDTIEGVQGRLRNLGFDCGRIDGILGPRTQLALRAFQKRENLPESGEPDDPTRRKLSEVHDAAG